MCVRERDWEREWVGEWVRETEEEYEDDACIKLGVLRGPMGQEAFCGTEDQLYYTNKTQSALCNGEINDQESGKDFAFAVTATISANKRTVHGSQVLTFIMFFWGLLFLKY